MGNAQRIEALTASAYAMAELAIMDLAIRATPAGSEALGFSLLMRCETLRYLERIGLGLL